MQGLAIGLPILAGLVGYLITYYYGWRIEQKKANLQLIDDKLQYLYGPLFALTTASDQAIGSLRRRLGREYIVDPKIKSYPKKDILLYRLWMVEILMPLNLKMEEIIVSNTHLIEGPNLPQPFLLFLAHIETYKAVIKQWDTDTVSEETELEELMANNTALIPYPQEYPKLVRNTFKELKKTQSEMIGAASLRLRPLSIFGGSNRRSRSALRKDRPSRAGRGRVP